MSFSAAMYGFDRVGYGVTEGNDVMVQVVGTHVTAQPLSFAIATIPGTADSTWNNLVGYLSG